MLEGEQLGCQVVAQHDGRPGPEADQQNLPHPEPAAAKTAAEAETTAEAKPKTSRADRFQQGPAAPAQFVEREGSRTGPAPRIASSRGRGGWH
ncbi:hypothetical protein GCM10009663_76910 [Kitasatospora arboriphila]|uniref:Uncharacterized protein n=1 Tax=Kitasatospora arboriphila TaxID=258052 RepID=A0ABN1U817_9ACTN